MSDEYVFTNNAKSTLAAQIGGAATSFTVETGDGALFPAVSTGGGEKFEVLVVDGTTSAYMTVTDRTGDIFSVTRSESNSFSAGATVKLVLPAEVLDAFMQKGVFRTVAADPDGTLTAEYDGEEVYDSVNEHFYKHATGTTWHQMT